MLTHADVSVIRIGRDHIPDFDPDPVDRALADLNGVMGQRDTMPLAELRRRLDYPQAVRESGRTLPSDVVLSAIILAGFAIFPWSDCPYGLLCEFKPYDRSLVWWRGEMYARDAEGNLIPEFDYLTGDAD